jgi:hypothetical protein
MKVATTKVYRQNRARFPVETLEQYGGQWVAFSADGRRIVAGAETIGQLSERVVAVREDLQDVVIEKIEAETDEIQIGGAALL